MEDSQSELKLWRGRVAQLEQQVASLLDQLEGERKKVSRLEAELQPKEKVRIPATQIQYGGTNQHKADLLLSFCSIHLF